jgi:hypothetical protein
MLKVTFSILAAVATALIGAQAHAQDPQRKPAPAIPPMEAPTGGSMTFDEEFQVLDPLKYNTAYHWGARWLNDGEQQAYVDPLYTGSANVPLGLNPFSVVDGGLRIRAAIADAEFPAGKGYWPAFWMIPKGVMPKPPEIDIVEALGDQLTSLFVTSHWNEQSEAKSKGFDITVPDMSADFHRYGALWTDTQIAWYFDGKRVAYTTTPPDLHSPMYLLLNLAVGGTWPGSPNSATKFPGDMIVTYIRAYSVN